MYNRLPVPFPDQFGNVQLLGQPVAAAQANGRKRQLEDENMIDDGLEASGGEYLGDSAMQEDEDV